MATNILMPALSPTMTEGTLSRWLKKEGENVRAGDVIAEIETDKATMEVEAVDEGVLGRILVQDGTEGVKVNEPIAILVEQGEAVPAAAPAAPRPRRAAPRPGAARQPAPQAAKPPQAPPRPAAPSGNGHDAGGERIFVSPLARRMAKQAGIDLAALKGSGPNGRIVKADIEAALQKGAPARTAACRGGTGARRTAGRADHRAAHAGAAQFDPEGDRAPADRGEIDHPAFLRLDGRGDRRADQADERAEREVAEGGAGRLSDHHQRPGDQGRRPRRCGACRR